MLERLGRGSYAEIFVARDTLASPQSPHKFVVIKALNVFLQDDLDHDLERTLVENFQNEAIALDRVRHPNIISRLGHGTARDLKGMLFHYLVLEYLEGGDLQKAMREKSLTLESSLQYIEQVCSGLAHAHEKGIIHRDIKPQNLLLTKDKLTVKIADFGVARVHQSDAPITRVGTNIYAAPEHSPLNSAASASSAQLTPAADIYSLAKTVYTLITGEAPRFYANSQITALPLHIREEPWADALLEVLQKATSDDPQQRQQTVASFWNDLTEFRREILRPETVTSVRPSFSETPQPRVSRGFSPVSPQRPKFDTSRDLKLRFPLIEQRQYVPPPGSNMDAELGRSVNDVIQVDLEHEVKRSKQRKQRKLWPRLMAFGIFLLMLIGGLYATQAYIRSNFPDIASIFSTKTGKANTDINLRPAPSLDNDPIGVVTKNSRVRIVKVQNNWYQVDIIEQGRERPDSPSGTRGWLNGKYVDLDN